MHSFYYNDIDRILKEKRMCLLEERKHLENETENFKKHSKSWYENSNPNINENSNISENSYENDLNVNEENCALGSCGVGGRNPNTIQCNSTTTPTAFTMFDNNKYDCNNNNNTNNNEDLFGNYTRNTSNNYSLMENAICNENLEMSRNHLLDNNNNNSSNHFDANLLKRFTTLKNIGENEQGITPSNAKQPIKQGKKYTSTKNKYPKLEKDDMDQWVTDAFFSYFPSINDQIKQKRSENLYMESNNNNNNNSRLLQNKELQPQQQRPLFEHHRTRKQDIKKQTKLEYQRDLIQQIEEKKREIEMLRVKEKEDDAMLTKKLEDQLKTMQLEDDLEIQKNKTEKLRLTNEQNHLQRMNLLSKLENDHKIYNPYNADRKSQSENGKENLVQKKKDDSEIYKYFSNSARRYADRNKCSIDLYSDAEEHSQNHSLMEQHDRSKNNKQIVIKNSMLDEQQNYCDACQRQLYYNQLFCINCKSKCLNCNSETLHNNNNNNNVRLPIQINSSSTYVQHQDHLNHPHYHQNPLYFNQQLIQEGKNYCQNCQQQQNQNQQQQLGQNHEHNLICKNCNSKFHKRINNLEGESRNFINNRKFKELNDVEQQTEFDDQLLLLKSSISSSTSTSTSSSVAAVAAPSFYGPGLKINDHNKKPIMTQPTITETMNKSIGGGGGGDSRINKNNNNIISNSRSSSESDHDVIIVKNLNDPKSKQSSTQPPYSMNIEKQSIFHPVNNRNVNFKSLLLNQYSNGDDDDDNNLFYHKTGIEAAAASSSSSSSTSLSNNSNVIKNRQINSDDNELELDKKTQDQINKYVKNYGDLNRNKKKIIADKKTLENSDDSFPLPLLREMNGKNVKLKDKIPDDRSTALKMLERKWEVPAVQKNSMGPSIQQQQQQQQQSHQQQKSSPRVLTQLGAIRKQLQLEQLKIDADDDDDDDDFNYGLTDDDSDDRDVKVYRKNIL